MKLLDAIQAGNGKAYHKWWWCSWIEHDEEGYLVVQLDAFTPGYGPERITVAELLRSGVEGWHPGKPT